MEKEKYIKEVEKHLLCKREKKRELCKELLSDIEAAIENGEQWEAVEKRLGTPKELADELNESRHSGQQTKNRSSLRKIVLIVTAIVLGCAVISIIIFMMLPREEEIGGNIFDEDMIHAQVDEVSKSGVFDEDTIRAQADVVIGLVNEDKWEELLENHSAEVLQTEEIKAALTEAKSQLGEWGAYDRITSEYMCEVKEKGEYMAMIQSVALYENKSITFTITFDEEMKLIGLYMK